MFRFVSAWLALLRFGLLWKEKRFEITLSNTLLLLVSKVKIRTFLTRLVVHHNRVVPRLVENEMELAPPAGPLPLLHSHHSPQDNQPLSVGFVTSFSMCFVIFFFLTFKPNQMDPKGQASTQSKTSLLTG